MTAAVVTGRTRRPQQGRGFYVAVAGAVALLFTAHLVLGSDPLTTLVAALTILVGLYPLTRWGVLDIRSILVGLVVFRYVGFPFVAKLALGQPLQANLADATGAFLVVFVGVVAYTAAAFIAGGVRLGPPLLRPMVDATRLRRLAIGAGVIGAASNGMLALEAGHAFTGIASANFITSVLMLGVIFAVASVIIRTDGRRTWDALVLALVVASLASAAVVNSRLALVQAPLAYVLTTIAFRGTVNWRRLSLLIATGAALVIFVTPVFLTVRGSRTHLSWGQRIQATVNATLHWPTVFAQYRASLAAQSTANSYLLYYGSTQNVLERLSLVDHVSVLKRGADASGTVGTQDLTLGIERALPRFLAPNKPRGYSQGDWLYCAVHIYCAYGGYSTAPLIGAGYAAFGWLGALAYPLLLGTLLLIVLEKVGGWSLQSNVWAVFLLMLVQNDFVEGGSATYLVQMLRSIPQDVLLIAALLVFVGGVSLFGTSRPGRLGIESHA